MLFTNARVDITCCACGRFFILFFFLVMFLLLCLHKHACILWKRIQGPYYQGTSTKHTYHAVNSTDKNSKAAVIGHAFWLKKTLPC